MKDSIKKYEEFLKEKGIQEEKNTPAIMSAMKQVIGEILIDNKKMRGQLQKMEVEKIKLLGMNKAMEQVERYLELLKEAKRLANELASTEIDLVIDNHINLDAARISKSIHSHEKKGIEDVLKGVDGNFVIGGIEYDPATGEGALKKMESKKGVLITMKIGENEMKGFVSKVSDKEVSSEESLEFYNSTFEGYEQRLSLVASRVYTKLEKMFKKEEIRTVAEILEVLANSPSFLESQTENNIN
ncbi:hypothetical protein B834_853 [Enterococcus mundtii 1A]|uniref:hypothetical protein n=1 Tax=Enterococcus mundtii TaxID=53346 RepID=UPI002302DF3D|nr:hypothetical protein [Enterococcus mundtii]MDA9428384.1 hypothetical protein [Enterococcus mundtii 1A]